MDDDIQVECEGSAAAASLEGNHTAAPGTRASPCTAAAVSAAPPPSNRSKKSAAHRAKIQMKLTQKKHRGDVGGSGIGNARLKQEGSKISPVQWARLDDRGRELAVKRGALPPYKVAKAKKAQRAKTQAGAAASAAASARSSARMKCGHVVASVAFLCVFLLVPASGSALWGTQTTTEYLEIDVRAGTSTAQRCSDCKQSDQQKHGVSTTAGSVLYTLRNHDGVFSHGVFLHGFDSATKKTTLQVALPFSLFSGSFATGSWAIAAKPNSTSIFALGPTDKNQPAREHSLYKVDTATHTVTLVTKTTSYPANANSGAYDGENDVFYWIRAGGALGSQAVKGVSTVTGNVTCDVGTALYTIDYDSATGSLVGLGFAHNAAPPFAQFRQLVSLDLSSFKQTTLLNITDHASNLPATAFDAARGVFVCMMVPQDKGEGADLVAIDVRAPPKVLSSPALCSRYDACPWNLGWLQ